MKNLELIATMLASLVIVLGFNYSTVASASSFGDGTVGSPVTLYLYDVSAVNTDQQRRFDHTSIWGPTYQTLFIHRDYERTGVIELVREPNVIF